MHVDWKIQLSGGGWPRCCRLKEQILYACRKHFCETDARYLKEVFWRDIWHAAARTHSKGVTIRVLQSIPWNLSQAISDTLDRFVIFYGSLGKVKLTIVGVHAPNDRQVKFWDELCSCLYEGPQTATIFLGDFNSVVEINRDQSRVTKTRHYPVG